DGAPSLPTRRSSDRLTAEPNLVQQWNAAWTYPVQNNDALTHFTVHRVVHGASFDYDTDTVGTVTQAEPLPLFGYDVDFSFAMTGDRKSTRLNSSHVK